MPAGLTRQHLLRETSAEYERLLRLIGRVSDADMVTSSVNSAGWSLKDVLAHVADWAERCERWCEAGLRGDDPQPPAPGFKWNETPRLNHEIFLKRRRHSLSRVLRDVHAGHGALVRRTRSMDDADLCEPGRFAWCGPTWSAAKHIRANSASHYRWASQHFKKWLRSGSGKGSKRPGRAVAPASRDAKPRGAKGRDSTRRSRQ